ncbi:hypothetical protein GE09DRAFT_1252116 [Coniochaeta sp. 2T2.1]|nr:hypothetical protein GE09DRAFT_1252116 [Coniochaeta sp. 2T2.1]
MSLRLQISYINWLTNRSFKMASLPVTAHAKVEVATLTVPASSAVDSDAGETDDGEAGSPGEVFDSQPGSEEGDAEEEDDEEEDTGDEDEEDEDAEEEEAAEEENKLPLEGCEIGFCGSFGRNYPREVLWDMVKELKGGKARAWTSDAYGEGGHYVAVTHVIASRAAYNQAYSEVVFAEYAHGRPHIVQLDWLRDCYARKRRMDERAYYFREAPTIMEAVYPNGCRIRPYEHLLSRQELLRRLNTPKKKRRKKKAGSTGNDDSEKISRQVEGGMEEEEGDEDVGMEKGGQEGDEGGEEEGDEEMGEDEE